MDQVKSSGMIHNSVDTPTRLLVRRNFCPCLDLYPRHTDEPWYWAKQNYIIQYVKWLEFFFL